MMTRTLPASALPPSAYARRVAEHGHQRGILLGRDLRGSRDSLAWFARQRAMVRKAARTVGVIMDEHGTWTDQATLRPVRIVIEETER